MSDDTTTTLKVVLLGDVGVGKSCLRSQLVHRIFVGAYKATIGADYLTTVMSGYDDQGESGEGHGDGSGHEPHGGRWSVSLQVWDTAGQERFNSISQAFYRGADVAVFVYDVTNYESLLSVREWFARFMAHCRVAAPAIVIVGNKSDKVGERTVELAEVKDILCRRSNTQAEALEGHVDWARDVMEASAKDFPSVEAVFRRAATSGLSRSPSEVSDPDPIDLRHSPSSSCAC